MTVSGAGWSPARRTGSHPAAADYPTEGDRDSLILDGQDGGVGLLRPGQHVLDEAAAFPLGDGF